MIKDNGEVYIGNAVGGTGGGEGAVDSVFGRTGVVVSQPGDYTTSQVTESTDKNYVTDAQLVDIDTISSKLETVSTDASITGDGTSGSPLSVVAGSWGSITGTLSDQTDLQSELDSKADISLLTSNIVLYPTTAVGDFGYNRMVSSIEDADYDDVAVDVSTGTISGANQLVAGLIADAGLFTGNPGVITVPTIGNIRKVSGKSDATFYFELYQRNLAGTETLVFTSGTTPEITSDTYELFYAFGLLNNGIWLDTDRIVIKYYANKQGNGPEPTYDFKFGGENPVRTNIPVPVSVIPASDFNSWTTTNQSSNYTAVGNNVILCDTSAGGFTVTLPLAVENKDKTIMIKKISNDGGAVTVDPQGAETIDNDSQKTINFYLTSFTVISDGSNWWVV
jgi:hypothetical protein